MDNPLKYITDEEPISIHNIKELTGGDTLYARPLRGENDDNYDHYIPKFNILLIGSKLPMIINENDPIYNDGKCQIQHLVCNENELYDNLNSNTNDTIDMIDISNNDDIEIHIEI